MDATASADSTSPGGTPSDQTTPDQKLACLGSWLQRATLKEAEALQARFLLPAGALTVGSLVTAAFAGMDRQALAVCVFLVFAFGAQALFHIHHRRWSIWRAVAVRLQTEQKLILGGGRTGMPGQAGCHPPEKLAKWFDKQEPLRPFCGPAIALHAATLVLATMLLTFDGEPNRDRVGPNPAMPAEPWFDGGNLGTRDPRPIF